MSGERRRLLIVQCVVLVITTIMCIGSAADAPSPSYRDEFLKAAKFLEQKKLPSALTALDKTIALNPKFVDAYLHRARLYTRLGQFMSAQNDYKQVLKLRPSQKDAIRAIETLSLEALARKKDQSVAFVNQGKCSEAIPLLIEVTNEASSDANSLNMLAQCQFDASDFQESLMSASQLLKADYSHINGNLLSALSYFKINEDESAIRYLRQGLQFDPDHKVMKKYYKALRSLHRSRTSGFDEFNRHLFADAIDSFQSALEIEIDTGFNRPIVLHDLYLKLCQAHTKNSSGNLAANFCNKSLMLDRASVEAWVALVEAHIGSEEYQEAVNQCNQAKQSVPNQQAIHDACRNAENELKKSKRKDYYKILGLSKSCRPADIKKAYRKLAFVWHPDRRPRDENEAQKKISVETFRDVNEANEILKDPNLRARYDNGEDMSEGGQQQQQQQSGFNFHSGYQFQSGSGFHFNFGH